MPAPTPSDELPAQLGVPVDVLVEQVAEPAGPAGVAGGPGRFRYLLYKDVNRHAQLSRQLT